MKETEIFLQKKNGRGIKKKDTNRIQQTNKLLLIRSSFI